MSLVVQVNKKQSFSGCFMPLPDLSQAGGAAFGCPSFCRYGWYWHQRQPQWRVGLVLSVPR